MDGAQMTTNLLSKYSPLISLDKEILSRFKSQSTSLILNKGDFVFQASTHKKYFYILLSGRVKLCRVSSAGREVTQWFCFPGEIFGLAELPRSNHQTIYAQCCEKSEILAIPLSQFNNFIKHSPENAIKIIEQLSVRLKIVGESLLNFTSDDVKTRLIKLLTRLNMRFGISHENGILISVTLTHKEMSDMIGACRQSVTTALGELKTDGYIELINSNLFIPSIEKFEKLTNS